MTETARSVPNLNWANVFTVLRVFMVPVFAWLLVFREPSLPRVAAIVFAAAAATDGLDGFVARRLNLVSGFGKFLDPLADKLLVGTALIALAADHRMSWIAVGIIGFREIAIMVMRVVLARRGRALPASRSAKFKTGMQMLAVMCATLLDRGHVATKVIVAAAVVATLQSGVGYVRDGLRGQAGEKWR